MEVRIGLRNAGMAVALGAIAIGGAAPEGAVSPADGAAVQGTIRAQIEAFRRDDADAAYRLASSHIEAEFGSPARFLSMVAAAYPAVYRARDLTFGPVVRVDGVTIQQVGIVGPDGGRNTALYSMDREAGGWRIDGCVLTADTGRSI